MQEVINLYTQKMSKRFYDPYLLVASITLLGLGVVMVTSASLSFAESKKLQIWYFAYRHVIALSIGILAGWLTTKIPMTTWRKLSVPLLLLNIAFLIILLIPGVGRAVNGSVRWLFLGPISIQVSEFTKLAFIIYMAGYLVRREDEVRTKLSGFLKPLFLLSLISFLLLLEPDFGAAVVITATIMGLLFLGGVPLHRFLGLLVLVLGGLAFLAIASPYRLIRVTTFLNPWNDQFNTGYQLTQSLIAFGRGGLSGVGLGNSVQKLLYLPEPYTDFLYAVLAEELGLVGAISVLLLFAVLVWRAFCIGKRSVISGKPFSGFVAYGIALWLGLQTFINIGVNVGVLPTKGLTLPLMSYGGCSLIVGLISLGLLLRIDLESRKKTILK